VLLVYLPNSKLQSDLKTTKFDETKIALEVCYKEIQRLRTEKLAPTKTSTPRYYSTLRFNSHISRWTWLSQYPNVSILDLIGATDDGDGGANWNYKTCKAPVKPSPPANQHPPFYRPNALPVA